MLTATDRRPNSVAHASTPSINANAVHGSSGAASAARTPGDWPAAKADGLATIASGNDRSMYGPSSTVAFLRHVMPNQGTATSPDPGALDARSINSEPRPRSAAPMPERVLPQTDGLAVLPRRRQADNFLLCYWEFIHPLFPVLHQPTFTRKYEALWIDSDVTQREHDTEAEEAAFMSTLNLVFAIGCKFSTLVEHAQKQSVAEDFFQKSRQAYPFDVLDSNSISAVQMLVLTGVYLQSTQHASRCWNSLGLAIRMAQLLAMTFGRPSMLGTTTDVPIPGAIDDEYLADRGVGIQPANVPSRLGLFVSSCRLFELLEEVLERFYRDGPSQKQPNGTETPADIVGPVLDLNRRLDVFEQSVPGYLRVFDQGSINGRNEDHVQLQQQVLYCRFLYVRLLSLRPLLLLATKREQRTSSKHTLDDEVTRSCCNRCVLTARRLIDTLYDNIGTLYRASGWHSVYFTFSSAMVLLASWQSDDDHTPGPEMDQRESSWVRCLAILDHYVEQIHSAHHAVKILKTIKAQIWNVSRANAMQASSEQQKMESNMRLPAEVNAGIPTAEMYPQLSLDDPELFSADNIAEAWYGQQLVNLDWLEIPNLYG
ncbi:hypothetical protein AC579_3123 [Pseudocercospora musae]|uniref:Xylanolytic transcriptional activator regulatory domain-containing protein n=1 Tax=Pseudocercospora musae TaxID=113226 RepID=A0A139IAM3_9PEZI|nr:hypothetical protein AC579_3123 [Pseudocercospora musae]